MMALNASISIYEKAAKEFQKTIELSSKAWFLYQTCIKLGICYKELKNHQRAVDNLNKGKEFTTISLSDPDTKQKWIAIADPFFAEIARIRS